MARNYIIDKAPFKTKRQGIPKRTTEPQTWKHEWVMCQNYCTIRFYIYTQPKDQFYILRPGPLRVSRCFVKSEFHDHRSQLPLSDQAKMDLAMMWTIKLKCETNVRSHKWLFCTRLSVIFQKRACFLMSTFLMTSHCLYDVFVRTCSDLWPLQSCPYSLGTLPVEKLSVMMKSWEIASNYYILA